jgi:hypothetical protein
VPTRGWTRKPKHAHRPGAELRFPFELDPTEAVFADRVLYRVVEMTPIQIQNLAYDTEPMQAILSREKEIGAMLVGELIEFDLVKKNPIYRKWKTNMRQTREADANYEAFLKSEREEAETLLASLE